MEYLKYYNSYASLFNTSQHSHVDIILFLPLNGIHEIRCCNIDYATCSNRQFQPKD